MPHLDDKTMNHFITSKKMEKASLHWCFMRVTQSSEATKLIHYNRVNMLQRNTRMKLWN